jgi:transposase
MTGTDSTYAPWLSQAQIAEQRLTTEQRGLLQAAFAFRQRCGDDYYSNRLLSHFLLHCNSGLKVAQIARLVGVSRPTASHQQAVSSKEAIQAAHHRMAGRAYGKLLPRYAGPIAEFILSHPEATRYDVLDFIQRTWDVHVSTVALHHFCKKYGLNRATRTAAAAAAARPAPTAAQAAAGHLPAVPHPVATVPAGQPVPLPPPPFSRHGPSTRARSS